MSFRISAPPLPLRLAASLAACLAVFAAVGCSKVSPVAPSGTTITLSASPSFISSGSGSTTITAVVRKPNGTPVANGTEVRFTTDLGSISPIVATTSSGGVATATLTADGRLGKATVGALVGGGATATTLAVTIGTTPTAKTITLQSNPASIPSSGGTVRLVALVRDSTGQPVSGAPVSFTTNLGSLASGGGLIITDASGQAADRLTLQSTDVGNQTSIMVGASTVGSDGSLQSATFTVSILTNAATSIVASANPTQLPLSGGTVKLTALVRNATGGPVKGAGVNFSASLGTLASGGGLLTTDANGQVTDTLSIPAQSGPGPITVTVTATTAGAGSTLITSNIVTITLK
jgi:hypothetical protein